MCHAMFYSKRKQSFKYQSATWNHFECENEAIQVAEETEKKPVHITWEQYM